MKAPNVNLLFPRDPHNFHVCKLAFFYVVLLVIPQLNPKEIYFRPRQRLNKQNPVAIAATFGTGLWLIYIWWIIRVIKGDEEGF